MPLSAAGQALDEVAGVELRFMEPAVSQTLVPALGGAALTDSASIDAALADPLLAAGRALLHRRGCTTCHGLDIPGTGVQKGKDLAGIAAKASVAWLDAWLADPFTYLPDSKMPQVQLDADERAAVVAFLAGLEADGPLPVPPQAGDPYRGGRLFAQQQCDACHVVTGEGGQSGPALDLLARKTSRQWLYAMLVDPKGTAPVVSAHDFGVSPADAADMSAFMARRFTGGVTMPERLEPPRPDAGLGRRGLEVAIRRGCIQCHAVGPLAGPPLERPKNAAQAAAWVVAHRKARGPMVPIALDAAERRAMQAALIGPQGPAAGPLPATFWDLPVAAHPSPPAAYSHEARSLDSEACGGCHVQQWQEWTTSRHARAMSPGLLGQIVEIVDENPAFVRQCLNCHAPLAEQGDKIRGSPTQVARERGITCAGCHVRGWRIWGPAAAGRLPAAVFTGGQHGGAVASADFAAADYCRPCHQAGDTSGFPLQDTYREWLSSPQARQGMTCQECHMPGGDHSNPGIHQRQIVARALQLEIDWRWADGGRRIAAEVSLHNRGAGHRVPTYATPAIFVKVFLSDAEDVVVESSLQTRVAQRRITLATNEEVFDTRIPAGGSWVFAYETEAPAEARFLNVLVEVDPDHFYRGFFERFTAYSRDAETYIRRAHAQIIDSDYLLFARRTVLEGR